MKPVIFLPEAADEMNEASRFYESRAAGLGQAFLDEVQVAADDIAEHPRRWPIVRRPVRRRMLGRFPYGLLYREESQEVVVVAVMHLHRRPGYWVSRLKPRGPKGLP
jgi:toxin ParE1/3/4